MRAEEYAKRRLAFVISGDDVVFQDNNNRKTSEEWIKEEFGVDDDEYETVIRGGLFPNRITLSLGTNYDSVSMADLSAHQLIVILRRYKELYGRNADTIYNGQFVGTVGVDWEPKEIIKI